MRVFAIVLVMSSVGNTWAQTSGNVAYSEQSGRARTQMMDRNLTPPGDNSMFVDANVLINVKADEYVAVFGVSQEGTTVQEVSAKMDATVKQFTAAVKALHVRESDIYVDFVTEPKIYGFEVAENVAREKLAGFELKKNISVHYTDRDLLDKLMIAATDAKIYDLIKVDYVVKDVAAVQDSLMVEASGVIKMKLARDEKLLGIKTEGPAVIYAERPAIYYPSEMYDSYTAADSESMTKPPNMSKMTVEHARREKTFFFNGLNANGFDKVLNPVVVEPVVQFTLYLKVKYDVVR